MAERKKKPEDRSIEELFGELDQIVGELEDGAISLEEAFHHYEAGMRLVKACSGKIDQVEKQILILNQGMEGSGSEQ